MFTNNGGGQRWFVWRERAMGFSTKAWLLVVTLTKRFIVWLRYPVPRWRPATAILLLFAITWSVLLYTSNSSFAATYTFVQSSWAGGLHADTTGHPSGESGWTKYSAATNIDVSSGVKVANSSITKDENFSTTNTTADKDAGNTTAVWNASSALQVLGGGAYVSSATGGTITTSGSYTIHTFTGSGTFTPTGSGNVDYLVVGGGGAGGRGDNNFASGGGGGGAGGMRTGTLSVSGAQTVTVGSGGAGVSSYQANGNSGNSSVFGSITAAGGGGGGGGGGQSGLAGGSGGGGGSFNGSGNAGGAGNTPSTTPSQGNNGGNGSTLSAGFGGGGGGAGGAGSAGCSGGCGGGGSGTSNSYSGSAVTYAAGGSGTGRGTHGGASASANTGNGGGGGAQGTSGSGGSGIVIVRYYSSNTGTAQSIKVNTTTDNITWVTLTKSDTPGTGSVTYYVSNNGGASFNAVTAGVQYNFATANNDLRWKVVLTGNATVSSLSLNYGSYYTSATLTSSAYDSTDPGNLVAKVAWSASGETGSETVRLQIRTSPDGSTWSNWCGASDAGATCTGSNYFTSAENNVAIGSSNPVRSGGDDQWLQYKITLASGGSATATLSSITVTYVVNAPPEFNSVNGLVVSQITDSSDANYGKVSIVYSIRDSDTSTGTTNPGFVTPSFEYNIGGGYVAITSGNLSANATTSKAVDGTVFTTYTAYWDAKTQIPTNYLTTALIRATINDNEAANNTAQAVSATFTLDTKVPVISAFTIDNSQTQVTLTTTDNTALQYMLSNNADFSADGLNSSSGQWQTPGGNSINLNIPWTFAASPTHPTVYVQVRDTSGNTTSQTGVTPNAPDAMYIRDISDAAKDSYSMFVSWGVYSSVASATFQKYEVYRSLDGSSYSLDSTITDVAQNYLADFNLTAEQTYYYKVRTIDTNQDISAYSEVVSQPAHGSGGGNQTVAPVITSVTVAQTQSTWAKITWTTDSLSDSRVDYSVDPDTSFATGGQSVASFVTAHSVTLNNLTPNTNYLFKVRSTDPFDNTGTNDNGGLGFAFSTTGGPIISTVTQSSINDNAATIVWNTDRDADSYVSYSTNSDLSAPTRVGSATLVGGSGPSYTHSVSLTGLSSGVKYYYFVESSDALSNYSKDTNGGSYYSFTTSIDSTPPVISGVSVPVAAYTAAVVIWQTDKPATTQMTYGTEAGNYTTTTTLDTTLSIFHAIALNDLTQNTKYFYQVRSRSASGYEAVSPEADFTTGEPTIITVGGGGSIISIATDTTAPTISNIKAQNVTSFKATIAFSTNEDSVGIIEYGDDPNALDQSAGDASYGTSHAISLSGLATGTKYTFKVIAIDKAGNVATSDSREFTTKFFTESSVNITDAYAFQKEVDSAIEAALPSLAPPFIEKPQVSAITDSGATVTWRTNVKAYSAVAYGSDENYDTTKDNPYETEVSDTTNKLINHSLDLIGLRPDTLYHFSVHAFTLPQLQSKTPDLTFATQAPKISARIGEIGNNSFRATWSTSSVTTSVVEYTDVQTGESSQKSFNDKTLDHNVLVDGLVPGSTYLVNVYGINNNGNKVSIASAVKVTTSTDVSAPKITNIKISSALLPNSTSASQTIISWKTDEPANSTIFYKDGTALPTEKLPNKVQIKDDYVTDHAVVLSTLKPGGLYSIQVESVDVAGNDTIMPIRTIVVPVQAQSVLDIIFKNFEDTFQFLKGR